MFPVLTSLYLHTREDASAEGTCIILCLGTDVLVCLDSILKSRVLPDFLLICQIQVISINSTINPELRRIAYKTKAEFVEVCRKHRSAAGLLTNLAWRLLFFCVKAKVMIPHIKRNHTSLLRKVVLMKSRKMEVVEMNCIK